MHNSYLDTSVSSLNLTLNLIIGHLRKHFSNSLDGLGEGHSVSLSCPLEKVWLVLGSSRVLVVAHVPHGELDPREPVTHPVHSLCHPVLLLGWLSSSSALSIRSCNLRLRILTEWDAKDDPSCFLSPSLPFSLLLSLSLLSSASPWIALTWVLNLLSTHWTVLAATLD